MNKMSAPLRLLWALWFAVLCAASGNALALGPRGTQLDNWCAKQPVRAAVPHQSKPYEASGSCAHCHTGGNTKVLNNIALASQTCSGTGIGTTCGASINSFCIAKPPSNAGITTPVEGATVAQGQSLTFTAAAATNPEGFPLTYSWAFSNATSATGQSTAVSMNNTGSFTATLTVKNSVGMSSAAVVRTVSVAAPGANQPPVASITAPTGNTTVPIGGTVNFQGSGFDPENQVLSYMWTFQGGNPATSNVRNPAVSYANAGTYLASLVVTDASLSSIAATLNVTVATTTQKFAASIDTPCINVSVLPGGKVAFKGSASASANLPLSYNWRFAGGNPSSSKVQNPGSVSYANAGVYTATLTVTDRKGVKFEPATRVVTVAAANQAAPKVAMCAIVKNGDDDEEDEDEGDD